MILWRELQVARRRQSLPRFWDVGLAANGRDQGQAEACQAAVQPAIALHDIPSRLARTPRGLASPRNLDSGTLPTVRPFV